MESRPRVLLLGVRALTLACVLSFGLSGCAALKWPWWGKKDKQDEVVQAEQAEEDEESASHGR